jgi:hypothetical protein
MNPLRSRTGQIFAVLVVLTVAAIYFVLSFIGWTHPVAKLIGVYKYPVATLGEFVRYKRNPNQFYEAHSAAALSFDCERIRDDFVKLTQSVIAPELATSAETMVWRKGSILHLADPSVAGTEPFMTWKKQVVNIATIQHPREASHYGSLLQALFTSVAIHGRNAGEEFSVETKRGSKPDACG